MPKTLEFGRHMFQL